MKNKARVIYPDIPSAIRPVIIMMIFRYQIPPDNLDSSSESDNENEINDDFSQEYIPYENKRNVEPFNQHELNELTKDKNLLNYLGLY